MKRETTSTGPVGAIGSVPVCAQCGSERVAIDAFACWNPETGLWELENVYEATHCHLCEATTTFVWKRKDELARTRVRELNDLFRTEGRGKGTLMITAGVSAKGPDFIRQAADAVRSFDAFTEDNDPWGQHDFGAFELDGERIFWKIDPYDLTMTMGSPNPANDAVTMRVLTILLASEY